MFICNIPPQHNLRWIKTPRGLVLQEKVKGRDDCKDYWVWQDVPVIEDGDGNTEKVFNDDVIYD